MIELSNISFSYKNKKILDALSLCVQKGECVGIVGRNGCGKSTLLAIMSGALKPDQGTITCFGEDALRNHNIFAGHIGYVPQENPLIAELTVKDNLKLWYGNKLEKNLKEGFMSFLNISDFLQMPVHKLSGGMKKRVSLALAHANNPTLLILDEPSTALDLPCKEDIQDYLRLYLRQGGTMVITSHEEAELELCTRLFILKDGVLHPVSTSLRGKELSKQL